MKLLKMFLIFLILNISLSCKTFVHISEKPVRPKDVSLRTVIIYSLEQDDYIDYLLNVLSLKYQIKFIPGESNENK